MEPYAELHCKTNFSFLEGASHAEELVRRAKELDYYALAVTDRESLSGIVRAHVAARSVDVQLIIGAEIQPVDASPLVVWATDRESYGRLSRLLTLGRRRGPKGTCEIHFDDLAEHHTGLLAGLRWSPAADRTSGVSTRDRAWGRYRELWGDRLYLLAELHYGPDDRAVLQQLMSLAGKWQIPLVAAGDVHYHAPERMFLHDILTAIRTQTVVSAAFANAERHLRTREQLQAMFADCPAALANTTVIADRCSFSLDQLRYEYPEELAPQGQSPMEYLRELTWQGARWRYPGTIPSKVCRLLDRELQLIEELQYEAYFLTVWDLVRFARSRGILCQGRGSAANSAVCFCLGITSVDPERMDVLFERFISRERNEPPDIDVDFEHERREEVIQYLYQKYGRERAGMTAEVITYRVRSAIRDVGKALGVSLDRVDAVAKQVEGYAREEKLLERFRQAGVDPETRTGKQWILATETLLGFPRHLSQHVGGMVMTRGPLCELVPIENAAMPDRTVISWDKYDLDELGILKVDCLALGMLTAIRKCFQLIEQETGRRWTLANIPPDDRATYDMIGRADTMGVFQIESRAQMSMLPRLQPRCYYDLVIEVAIVRPGPIQGQMVHPYLRRRNGLEPVEYANDALRQVLEKTLGVPLFQEQAMQLAVVAAGFTPGEADQLRRAMGAWRRTGTLEPFRERLIQGMRERGLREEFAQQVYQQLRGFGEYGFPESHAASFALLVYVSAWLKCHYPAFFLAALLNSQPLGFYAPAQLVRDARQHGVTVLPVDVNHSLWDCTMSGNNAVRLGFRLVVGFSRQWAERMVGSSTDGGGHPRFRSVEAFAQQTRLPAAEISRLARAGAFGSLQRSRRQVLWDALAQNHQDDEQPLFSRLPLDDEDPVALPEQEPLEEVLTDYATTGLSIKAHPLQYYRHALTVRKILSARQLDERKHGAAVAVAGLVILRQRPATAKGITFVTLEDESGTVNLVVKQAIWDRFYSVARRSPAWVVYGHLQRKHRVTHVVARRLVDMSSMLRVASADDSLPKSRDFR